MDDGRESDRGDASAGAAPRGRPRWGRVVAGIAVILVFAVPCLLVAIAVGAGGTYFERRGAQVEGRAPGSVTFDAEDRRYVVALSAKPGGLFDLLSRTERRRRFRVRESDANEARCRVTRADGSTVQLRGDRQTSAEVVGTSYASVGRFDAKPGRTTVSCRFDPPRDLLGTVTETPLMVHGRSTLMDVLRYGSFVGVFVFAGLGTLLILWGTVWRRPRRA